MNGEDKFSILVRELYVLFIWLIISVIINNAHSFPSLLLALVWQKHRYYFAKSMLLPCNIYEIISRYQCFRRIVAVFFHKILPFLYGKHKQILRF